MNTKLDKFGSLAAGFYAWIVAIFFGGILLDIMYSNSIKDSLSISESSNVFSDVADGLLWLGVVVVLAAIGAVAFSWKSRTARSLFIASLLMISLEFITPVFFSRLFQDTQHLSIGPWLRITLSGLASLLGFTGMFAYYQQK
jgi:hypothetical protein